VTRIRDPIHGALEIDERERAVLDAPFVQRLRGVRQLGFSEMAFPGATHSRYAHALGACHVLGRLFDSIFSELPEVADRERERLRAAARVAVLLHDAGHPPFSHSSEAVLPTRRELGLPAWARAGPEEERATHEDYTLAILLDSSLTEVLRGEYGPLGLSPESIASLVAGRQAPEGPAFEVKGIDYWPLLRQLLSSELDADRMDYLLRDSYYTGVSYGRYDLDWLASQLRARVEDGVAELAIRHRGIFAFEDFLLSRYHMFISVYYHHTPVCFDRMLLLHLKERPGEFSVPADAESFLRCDDQALLAALRESDGEWAERITWRRPFRVVFESNPYHAETELPPIVEPLTAAGIRHFTTRSRGLVSKYFLSGGASDRLWVEAAGAERWVALERYTPLFRRYAEEALIERVYVDPLQAEEARRLVGLERA
jgi:HD superfamily phosphohydrolase